MTMAARTGVVLIGSGPSLNRIDPQRLRDVDTIAFNRSFLAWPDWGFAPRYHACLDPMSMAIIASELPVVIERYPQTQFFLHESAVVAGIEPNHRVKLVALAPDAEFAGSRERLTDLGNVGAISLQLLVLLGYRRVLLVGVDGVYLPDGEDGHDPNHFRQDYAAGRPRLTDADRLRYTTGWAAAASECRRLAIEVCNASEGTALISFATIDFSAGLSWLAAPEHRARMS